MPQQPPKHILLVDDEKDFIEPISFWLRSKGYDVAMASDGRQALDAISAQRPDIIFMDINMPGQGGLETLKIIRQTDQELPVILLTSAYGDEGKIVAARALGVSGFFAKNYTFEQLMQVLQVTLNTHRGLRPSPEDERP